MEVVLFKDDFFMLSFKNTKIKNIIILIKIKNIALNNLKAYFFFRRSSKSSSNIEKIIKTLNQTKVSKVYVLETLNVSRVFRRLKHWKSRTELSQRHGSNFFDMA
jgi:precorrin-3B methylase